MTRSMFRRMLCIDRDATARSRRLVAQLESLESRNLLTGGSVVQNGALVNVTPAAGSSNVAIVSDQNVKGTTMLDVNLNGTDHFFGVRSVAAVYYLGSGVSGAQTFINTTSLHVVGWGGSGSNLFEGGSGQDQFFGGSGVNVFDAGTGFDIMIGGTGTNIFNENPTGSGEVFKVGSHNTINVPAGASGTYYLF